MNSSKLFSYLSHDPLFARVVAVDTLRVSFDYRHALFHNENRVRTNRTFNTGVVQFLGVSQGIC